METDYKKILDCIDPSLTNRQQWVEVGMALKQEGQPFDLFDSWSARDTRTGQYRGSAYTEKVWDSFKNSGSGTVTGATLTHMAREQGHDPFLGSSDQSTWFGWDDVITADDDHIPVTSKSSATILPKLPNQRPVFQIVDFLESCFDPCDYVNILSKNFRDEDGRYKPSGAGITSISAGEYCDMLRDNADDPEWFENVFGSYDHRCGVWVRINPVEPESTGGRGISDKNIISYDNALIECDTLPLDQQMAMIEKLKIPYRAITYSGGKSYHVIVPINGRSIADYKEKVTWLHNYCTSNGFPIDTQNKNPSRLSRLPGCERNGKMQALIKTDRNPMSFDDFKRHALNEKAEEALEFVSFDTLVGNLPDKAPELIHGVLRVGHKLIISGPSKSGKSFLFISMGISIAEGIPWLGRPCERGKVLYVNLEIDERSFYHRVMDVYNELGIKPEHANNINIVNLRGKNMTMKKLKSRIIKLIKGKGYAMVMIDPIYKLLEGDENSASDMRQFVNDLDEIAQEGQCSIAIIHHYAKGPQAQKSVIDRASGSGVFARDPDAIIAMSELFVSDVDREEIKARSIEAVVDIQLKITGQWENIEKTKPHLLKDRVAKQELVDSYFSRTTKGLEEYEHKIAEAEELGNCPAFRISMVLREFKSPEDENYFFRYPIHVKDHTGVLEEALLEGDNSIEAMNKKKAEKTKKRADQKRAWYDQQRKEGKMISVKDIVERFQCSENTVRNWVNSQPDLKRENGWIMYEAEETPKKGSRGRPKKEEVKDDEDE